MLDRLIYLWLIVTDWAEDHLMWAALICLLLSVLVVGSLERPTTACK